MQSPPVAIAAAVSREIQGEHVFWAGSPDRWAYASKYWKTSLLAIPFAAFAIFGTYQVTGLPAIGDSGFAIFSWGAVFVLVLLSLLLSPLWAAWMAGGVYYVVTERRAIIFEKHSKLQIRSFPRYSVSGYDCVSSGGAGGSIIFERVTERFGRGTRVREIGFIGLPEYAAAEQALKKLVASGAV